MAPVADVIARMDEIVAPLRRSDGVSCFVRLYAEVTRGVNAELHGVAFADPHFLERLDVAFADLFFAALDARAAAPRAWLPLFEARSRPDIAPLQFALAGMNAHINRDLPVALVATCRELGIQLERGSPQHGDFERVNGVLARVEARVKRTYMTGWLRAVDRVLHRVNRLDDVVAMWNVERARDGAWTNAEALWALRGDARLSADYLTALDRMVGLAGRGLLAPAESRLLRLFGRLGFSRS